MALFHGLIQNGAKVNCRNYYGARPIHLAAIGDQSDILTFLLKNGADANCFDKYKDSPLHYAVLDGHSDVVKILLEHGADLNCSNKKNESPLHMAARKGHTDIVKILLNQGADINCLDKNDFSPLHMAANNGHSDTVKFLLQNGANANILNKYDSSPLHLVAEHGHSDIIKMLLQYGAVSTCLNQPNFIGFYPLHSAARGLHMECAAILLEHGALITQLSTDECSTVFHAAAITFVEKRLRQTSINAEEMVHLKKRTHEMLDLLMAYLQQEDHFSVIFNWGLGTVLHCFAAVDYATGIRHLAGAPYNHPSDLKNISGKTPLGLAMEMQSYTAILQLLDLDVEIQHQVQLVWKKWFTPDDEVVKASLAGVIVKLVDKGK
jgi:ankyrin repeat protein